MSKDTTNVADTGEQSERDPALETKMKEWMRANSRAFISYDPKTDDGILTDEIEQLGVAAARRFGLQDQFENDVLYGLAFEVLH